MREGFGTLPTLEERASPAMGDEEGDSIWSGRALMGEMKDFLAMARDVDLDLEILAFFIDADRGTSVWLVQGERSTTYSAFQSYPSFQ